LFHLINLELKGENMNIEDMIPGKFYWILNKNWEKFATDWRTVITVGKWNGEMFEICGHNIHQPFDLYSILGSCSYGINLEF
jgi:hypothetical protein